MSQSIALSTAFALVMMAAAPADAASLRTAPFNGLDMVHGNARCAITNASSATGTASATLYDFSGEVLQTITAFNIRPHVTTVTSPVSLFQAVVSHCECTVPNATTWRCTVLWISADGTVATSTP